MMINMTIHDDKQGNFLSNFAGQLFLSSVAWALSHWEWVTTTPYLAILDRSWGPCLTWLPIDGNIAQKVALCIISLTEIHAQCMHEVAFTYTTLPNESYKCQISNAYFKHVVRKGRNWMLSALCVAFIFFKSVLQMQRRHVMRGTLSCKMIQIIDTERYAYVNHIFDQFHCKLTHIVNFVSFRCPAQPPNVYMLNIAVKMHHGFRQNTINTTIIATTVKS